MIPIVIFITIIAFGVMLYFKNRVENRRIDRANKLADKQEELIRMLKEKSAKDDKDDQETGR